MLRFFTAKNAAEVVDKIKDNMPFRELMPDDDG